MGNGVKVHAYLDRMEYAYAACDLVVCRAGATSLAELTRCGLPSVLVPYPFAAADHQTENAKVLAAAGAACLVSDREAGLRLPSLIRELFGDPQRLREMADAARRLGKPEATAVLADAVLRVANEGRK
jgi:UDP-N-acetylglucosamine--N-acetylmuramyl-(pentapeptide) pyrophosphoryl-undecaprenol N-acetylglucosamine transferase